MSQRSKDLARSRRRATSRTPVTVLTRIHVACREGMHIACPGTVGKERPQDCLCDCHKGRKVPLKAVC
jgi:hypothetical protein